MLETKCENQHSLSFHISVGHQYPEDVTDIVIQ